MLVLLFIFAIICSEMGGTESTEMFKDHLVNTAIWPENEKNQLNFLGDYDEAKTIYSRGDFFSFTRYNSVYGKTTSLWVSIKDENIFDKNPLGELTSIGKVGDWYHVYTHVGHVGRNNDNKIPTKNWEDTN